MDAAKDLKKITKEEAEYLGEHGTETRFDDDGNAANNNRATRRRKPLRPRIVEHGRITVPDQPITKATHSIKLARAKSKKEYRKTH